GRDAPAPLAHPLGPGAAILDFGGRIGAVAHLVLEPLDLDRVARSVGTPFRREEAGERLVVVDARQRQEPVRHGGRTEPLVPFEQVAAVARPGDGPVRAYIGAALL